MYYMYYVYIFLPSTYATCLLTFRFTMPSGEIYLLDLCLRYVAENIREYSEYDIEGKSY